VAIAKGGGFIVIKFGVVVVVLCNSLVNFQFFNACERENAVKHWGCTLENHNRIS
jgi:hypothetical protein